MKSENVGRADGRTLLTAQFVLRQARAEPRLGYRPGMSREKFAGWQRRVRTKLRGLLGIRPLEPQPKPRLISLAQREGYMLQRWELYPETGLAVPFLALVPDAATRENPAPAVLCFPGTDFSKELLAGEPELPGGLQRYHQYPAHPDRERMGWHYARAGFVALCVDNPATQETRDPRWPTRSELSQHLIMHGRCYFYLSVQQGLELFRWARTLPFVDRDRIATSGFSLGTNAALMVGVLEKRVAAVVHNGHLGAQRDRTIALGLAPEKLWHVVPGMPEWFDRPDLAAALAPRPLLVLEGAAPWNFRRVRAAYRAAGLPAVAGAGGRLKLVYNPACETAASRRRAERLDGPPPCADAEELKKYILQDSPHHYFKPEVAVPWLRKAIGVKSFSSSSSSSSSNRRGERRI